MPDTVQKVLEDQVKDLYSVETQLVAALPKMVRAASNATLKQALAMHLDETRVHVERLEKTAKLLGIDPSGEKCMSMEALIAEGEEHVKRDTPGQALDLAIIAAASAVEHYEIASYTSARRLADRLDRGEVVLLLQANLTDEVAADKTLGAVAMADVLPRVAVTVVSPSNTGRDAGGVGAGARAGATR